MKDEDFAEIKRCVQASGVWKLGEERQLRQLSEEVGLREEEFLLDLKKSKNKKTLKRKSPGTPETVELQIPVPNGKYLTIYFINKYF